MSLIFFLSLSTLGFGVATLAPVTVWQGFAGIKWLLVISISGLAAVCMIRFLVSFQQEFKIMEPITNKRHIKLNEWKKKFELIFRGSRLIYVSFIIISAGILNEVIAETEPGETGTVLFILFASITSVYVPESLMLLYRYAEKIHRKRILWIAYGFYGAYVTALLLPLLRFILKMGGYNKNQCS